jgi:thiamine pyrophosphate-dependent acetolactate synthase large subunit-like protein
MLVDDAARWSMGKHTGAIVALSDYLKMPVAIAGSACRGLFGDESDNPLLKTRAFSKADVVLALDCRFDYRLRLGRSIPKDATVIQAHTDSARLVSTCVQTSVSLVEQVP